MATADACHRSPGAWPAFVVAIPDRYDQNLAEATTRLTETADQDLGRTNSKAVETVMLEALAELGFRQSGPSSDGAMS